MDSGFKVLVHGISTNISRSDFSDIFLKYGDMVTAYVDERNIYEGKRSGYVVYRDKRDCYRAISELNGQPPFNMYLQFVTSVNMKEENTSKAHRDVLCLPTQNAFIGEKCNRRSFHPTSNSEIESSTLFPLKVKFLSECKKCANTANKACAICGVLYCSKSCQIEDWKNHKNKCSLSNSGPSKSRSGKDISNTNNYKVPYVESGEKTKQVGPVEGIEPAEKFSASRLAPGCGSNKREIAGERERQFGEISRVGPRNGNGKMIGRGKRKNLGEKVTISKNFHDNFDKRCDEIDNSEVWVGINDKVVGQDAPEKCSSNQEIKMESVLKEKTNKIKITGHTQEISNNPVISGKNVNRRMTEGEMQEKETNSTVLPEFSQKSSQEKITAEIINSSNCNQKSIVEVKNKSSNTAKAAKTSNSTPNPWDLLSDNPETQIVNYDLCTQQKKLSTDKFTKVTVYDCLAPDEYWVHCTNELEELRKITRLLMDKRQPSEVPYKPSVGNYCSVVFGEAVFRSKVLSMKETKAKVFLIDYGIFAECEVKDMNDLPSIAKNYYAQAIHVKMDPWTPREYLNLGKDSNLSIKAVSVVDGLTKVQVEGVLYSQISLSPKLLLPSTFMNDVTKSETSGNDTNVTQWPPSVLGLLKEGHKADCTVLSVHLNADERKDEIILAIAFEGMSKDLESILINFPEDCVMLPEDPHFNPRVGDLVAAYYKARELWVRSMVLATGVNRWLVACCDLGVILEVTDIQKIPTGKNYEKVPSLATKCNIISSWLPRDDLFSRERIKENATLGMVIGKRKNDFIECKLGMIESPPFCTISLGVWAPEVDKPLISSFSLIPEMENVHLTSGANVKIVSYYLSLVLYVQPCDKESRQQIEDLQNSIFTHVEKSEPLKEVPKVGKKCICLFSGDMKHYRVVVNKVKSSKKISVTYVDFGNDEEVSLSRLYCIPPELEKIPCFAVKIGLKKDFEKLLNKDAHTFLSCLIAENAELTLNFPDGNLRCCELVMKNGSLVNDILERLIDPRSPRKNIKDS